MILYVGFQIFFSAGDEEKLKKARNAILYIAIGVAVLVVNLLIVTFFFRPDGVI